MRSILKSIGSIFVVVTGLIAVANPIRSNIAAKDNHYTVSNEEMVFVEYLESTGTQYINTGFIPDGVHKVRVEVDFQVLPPLSEYCFIIGSFPQFYFAGIYDDSVDYQFYVSAGFYYDQDGIIIKTYTGGGNKYERAIAFSDRVFTAGNQEWPLFGRISRDGTVNSYGAKRIYGCVIDSENFSLNLVPIRIGNTGFMLDTISGEIYGNQGEGSFIIGPDL